MADVEASIANWSSSDGSNKPEGTTSISTGLDDNLRAIQGGVVRGLSHKGADIASAATTNLGAVEGLFHDITGTTTITSFGTVRAGVWKILKFEGALQITHNATSMILLGGANRTVGVGDIGIYISEGSGNWREVAYFDASVGPLLFTPVQQGGGDNQGTEKINIGWLTSTLGLEVDGTDYGDDWPINVTGSAGSVTSLTASQVGAALAGLTIGDVGTVAMMKVATPATANPGGTVSGSNLDYSDASGITHNLTPSGTWRCWGYAPTANSSVSVFVRIS